MSVLPVGFGSAAGGYQIERSLRFNSADSAYLNRTVGSAATSNTLTTFSFWFKRAKLGTSQQLFASATSAPNVACYIELTTSDTLKIYLDMTAGGSDETTWTTSAVFRDVSAWYGATIKVDTSQASNANKVVLYINNVSQTLTASQTGTAVSTQRILENGISLTIGKYFNSSGYGDFYLTEFYAIDGQALTPSSFGETDSATGVWKPKAYSGTYGTNGFYLKFADNSGTTSTTLGKDYSGNGNNWTPNNFSVTAGAGNDSLVDSPTNYGTDTGVGGEVRGNYATLNPLSRWAGGGSVVLSEGNLKAAFTNQYANHGTIAVSSGKYYWEAVVTSAGINSTGGGIMTVGQAGSNTSPYLGWVLDVQAGRNYYNNSYTTLTGGSFASGDRLGVAVDMDNGKIWYAKNGTWLGTSADPAAGTGAAQTNVSGEVVPVFYEGNSGFSATWEANFGQRAFAYTAPSGFKALCTQNLPTPTIGATSTTQANDYFNVKTYTGTGTQQSLTGVGFQPDFIWFKSRSTVANHALIDAVRGRSKLLFSSLTDAEATSTTTAKDLVSFDADGFTVGVPEQNASINTNGTTNVAWNWKANGAGSSNTAGTITSTVSASTTSGFSIVSFNAGAAGNKTVGHGLSSVPSLIIMKDRQSTGYGNWSVFHSSVCTTTSNYLLLNGTGALGSVSNTWGSALPTSSVFGFGSNVNIAANDDIIAYCFAPVAGYSAFGSYTGNGSSTDGPFVYTGFRPRFVLLKSSSLAGSFWNIVDTARNSYNVINTQLYPNSSAAEATVSVVDTLSNGFKIRTTNTDFNSNTNTYIYMALAENPFKYSLAR